DEPVADELLEEPIVDESVVDESVVDEALADETVVEVEAPRRRRRLGRWLGLESEVAPLVDEGVEVAVVPETVAEESIVDAPADDEQAAEPVVDEAFVQEP